MIFTRRFGALRARPVFPSVIERDEVLEYFGDVRLLDDMPQDNDRTTVDGTTRDSGESAA